MGLIVLGMHRSGTSVAAAMTVALGARLTVDADVMPATDDNPFGYFESIAVGDHDERLLELLDGGWDVPPRPERSTGHELDERVGGSRELFNNLHQLRPWVWKDPRACLLMEHWRRALDDHELAVVLVWRNPADVIDSLARRDAMSPDVAEALWRQYNASALRGAAGLPTLVVSYERILADPAAVGRDIVALGELIGAELSPEADVTGSVDEHARRSRGDHVPDQTTQALADVLTRLDGLHPELDVDVEIPVMTTEVRITALEERSRRLTQRIEFLTTANEEVLDLRSALADLRLAHDGLLEDRDRRQHLWNEERSQLTNALDESARNHTTLLDAHHALRSAYDELIEINNDLVAEAQRRLDIIESIEKSRMAERRHAEELEARLTS